MICPRRAAATAGKLASAIRVHQGIAHQFPTPFLPPPFGFCSQVDELIKCLAIQVNAIAEEAQNAAHKALRGHGVKILKLAYLDQLEQANVYMKAHIKDCTTAAGMVMNGANRKYKSQAAEVVKLRNELRKVTTIPSLDVVCGCCRVFECHESPPRAMGSQQLLRLQGPAR